MRTLRVGLPIFLVVAMLNGCGGGGGDDSPGTINVSPSYVAGVYPASSTLINQCAAPRTGINSSTGRSYPDRAGSTLLENLWLRSWTNELYLWYNEVLDQNPGSMTTVAYFDQLKTQGLTLSGAPKDKFHFTYPTAQWLALSQAGVQAGYGAEFQVIASRPPRNIVVAFTQPGSPAATAGVQRGAQVISVDGADAINGASVTVLNAGLFPSNAGESHTFVLHDAGATINRTVTMTSANITSVPVQNVKVITTGTGKVGYMLFNDHIATSESQLIAAINQLSSANVNDLVLDIRYNGGGYLDIASELGFMIVGPTRTTGKTFERTVFNSKYQTTDPVTGQALTPMPFHSTSQGFAGTPPQSLPHLDLNRVYVLTSDSTCSASESVINGLRGVGVQVIQIGSTTCGKPYGFYPQDNCGTTYFSIEFKGTNQAGFGDYADGFSPANTIGRMGVPLEGCGVADDYSHALGDPLEGQLAAALAYRVTATCPIPATAIVPHRSFAQSFNGTEAEAVEAKSPLRENRWYRQR